MHTRIYKCAVMRWAHLQMRCANLQMRLHLNCENGRCRPLRRFPRHAAISPRQQGTMRRVSALTFTNAHFAHFYAQKGPFPKPQVGLSTDPVLPVAPLLHWKYAYQLRFACRTLVFPASGVVPPAAPCDRGSELQHCLLFKSQSGAA